MLRAFFLFVFSVLYINLSAQSDTIFIEEYDTIYLAPKTVVIDSIVYVDRKPIKQKTSVFLTSGIYSPQLNSDFSSFRSTYSDSINSALSNFIGFRNGIKLQHNFNKIILQFGVDYSYTRFKFSHIDIDSLAYSCHNSIRGFQFSTLIGYKIAQIRKFSITPLLGIKIATIQKVSGLVYNPNEINFRSYLSEIATFNNSYFTSNFNIQFTYSTKKLVFGLAPDIHLQLSKPTKTESVISFKGWDFGILALVGYTFK